MVCQETLNARTEYDNDEQDGRSHHRINQYIIKEEIGHGSYGAVHLATDLGTGIDYVRALRMRRVDCRLTTR